VLKVNDKDEDDKDKKDNKKGDETIVENSETQIDNNINNKLINVPLFYEAGTIIDGYKIIEPLKKHGGQSDLFKVSKGDELYIMKIYRYNFKPKEDLLTIIKNLSDIGHDYLVKIIDIKYVESINIFYEVQEYVDYGSLEDWINEQKKFSEDEIKKILKEISNAINFLHNNNIVHRDIKPSNILVRNKDVSNIDLILTDFGISSILPPGLSSNFSESSGVTFAYSAPELFSNYVTKTCDYWSLGIILYELLMGENPFKDKSYHVIFNILLTENRPVIIPNNLDQKWKILLRGLLQRNYKKRFGYQEINEWFENKYDILEEKIKESELDEDFLTIKPLIVYDDPEKPKITNLEDLVKYSLSDCNGWNRVKALLRRGQVRNWVANELKDYGLSAFIENLNNEEKDNDLFVFKFIYKIKKDLPFIFYGIYIADVKPVLKLDCLIDLLKGYYYDDKVSNPELEIIVKYLCEKNLFSLYLELIDFDDTSFRKKIENIEKTISNLDNTKNKALTYALMINDEYKEIQSQIENLINTKIYPYEKNYFKALDLINNRNYVDGDLLLNILSYLNDYGYEESELEDIFEQDKLIVLLYNTFQNNMYSENSILIKDILYQKLFSQFCKFKKYSEDYIKNIEKIENYIEKYDMIRKRSLAFYILLFNRKNEIKKNIVEKFDKKVIPDPKLDSILNNIRKEVKKYE